MKLRYYEEASNQRSQGLMPWARAIPPHPAPKVEKLLPTVFVFRNGRQFTATDYAIFGNTLWIFGNQTAKQIPLSLLNLAASKKLNDQRGVNFVLPD